MPKLASAPFFNGTRFYYPPNQAADYCVAGPNNAMGFEPKITQYLRGALQKDMVFLDVGAANGYYTVLAANSVRDVVAFEPKASQRVVLLENIRRNGLKNVTVVEKPLFSRAARGFMRKDRLRLHPDGDYETITLDSLCLSPGAVKVDVEGAELDVLRGAEETLRAHKPILVVEIHEHKIKTFDHHWTQVSDFLRHLGYTVTYLGRRRLVQFIKAEFK